MTAINNNVMLTKLRIMAEQARSEAGSIAQPSSSGNTVGSFKDILDNVNELQKNSSELKTKFEMGDPSVSLAQVMVEGQKSSIAFEATLRVRNKLIEAYHDIMNMPL